MVSSRREVQILIEQWRKHHNAVIPHHPLGYAPTAPEAFMPMEHTNHAFAFNAGHPILAAQQKIPCREVLR